MAGPRPRVRNGGFTWLCLFSQGFLLNTQIPSAGNTFSRPEQVFSSSSIGVIRFSWFNPAMEGIGMIWSEYWFCLILLCFTRFSFKYSYAEYLEITVLLVFPMNLHHYFKYSGNLYHPLLWIACTGWYAAYRRAIQRAEEWLPARWRARHRTPHPIPPKLKSHNRKGWTLEV